jgi:mono/diheme cytochrome c family protein
VARLAARLGRELLAGFKLDLAVVARAGEGPGDAGVLFGSPSLFQRLYHSARHARAREGNLFAAAFRALIPGPAHADETTGPTDLASLVDRGEFIFFNETFEGNGRTCGTCHPANNNLTLDPAFIATLPPDDPLFVAEFQPALAENFENPVLMRRFGLILENVDGFGDLQNKFVMRGVPHTLALSTSRTPAFFDGTAVSVRERTGWGGDGAPGTGTLREFALGAVRQHFTKTLNRIEGADFRLPTNDELDALEAFQLSLGRSEDLNLSTMVFKGERAALGKQLFLGQGKCFNCHADAGANVKFGPIVANANFNTGVEDAPNPAAATGEPLPRDGGFGTTPNGDGKGGFGNGTFNTPPLVEAADTPPFFHNNAVDTLEEAVAFYNSDAFNSSPGAQRVGRITLTDDEVAAIAGFLRVINALENIRSSIELYERAEAASDPLVAERLLRLSGAEIGDAIRVLRDARLHPAAVRHLEAARGLLRAAIANPRMRERLSDRAIAQQKRARAELIAD